MRSYEVMWICDFMCCVHVATYVRIVVCNVVCNFVTISCGNGASMFVSSINSCN